MCIRDRLKTVSVNDVLKAFNLEDGGAIPILTMVQCAQPEELMAWSGEIKIIVTDEIAHQTTSENLMLDLKKPEEFGKGYGCH